MAGAIFNKNFNTILTLPLKFLCYNGRDGGFMLNEAEETDKSDFIDMRTAALSFCCIALIRSAVCFFKNIHILLETGTGFPDFDIPADIGIAYT